MRRRRFRAHHRGWLPRTRVQCCRPTAKGRRSVPVRSGAQRGTYPRYVLLHHHGRSRCRTAPTRPRRAVSRALASKRAETDRCRSVTLSASTARCSVISFRLLPPECEKPRSAVHADATNASANANDRSTPTAPLGPRPLVPGRKRAPAAARIALIDSPRPARRVRSTRPDRQLRGQLLQQRREEVVRDGDRQDRGHYDR